VILLVGHGAPPRDYPSDRVRKLKMLEGERRRTRSTMSEEERKLDTEIRAWPRSPKNDPYREGVEALALALRSQSAGEVMVAYNEFCGPSVEDAIAALAERGITRVIVLPTMFTPGGVHSEEEIPEILELARKEYPSIQFDYVWPFDIQELAAMMLAHVRAP
jgi:sirohydrochlorin cobaltochelatase